jgi:hypothetical protein
MEMSANRFIKVALAHLGVFGVAAAVAWGCQVDFPDTAFQCDPSTGDCPDGYICCSDDPAALDLSDSFGNLEDFVTPKYDNRSGGGTPLFSGNNNSLSRKGMCVKDGVVPPGAGLAEAPAIGCPVPCNPNWGDDDIEDVCGGNALCCQTVQLEVNDCVLDESENCVRAVVGGDVYDGGVTPTTNWSKTAHSTHQDPGPSSASGACNTFVQGANAGNAADALFEACVRRLTVADARGFCLGLSPTVTGCPLEVQGIQSTCALVAAQEGLSLCN